MSQVKIKNRPIVKQKPAPIAAIAPSLRGDWNRVAPHKAMRSSLWAQRNDDKRQKLTRLFTEELCADFEEYGASAIEACRLEKPDVYVKVVASLLPKEVKIQTEASLSNDELESALLRYLAGDLAKIISPGERGPAQTIEGKAAEEGSE